MFMYLSVSTNRLLMDAFKPLTVERLLSSGSFIDTTKI